MDVKPEKKRDVAIGLLMRDTGQSVKVKSYSSPCITPRLVVRRAVKLSMFRQRLCMEGGQF